MKVASATTKIHKVFKRRRKNSLIWYLKIFELMKKVFFPAITGQYSIPHTSYHFRNEMARYFFKRFFSFTSNHHWLKWMNEKKVTQNSQSVSGLRTNHQWNCFFKSSNQMRAHIYSSIRMQVPKNWFSLRRHWTNAYTPHTTNFPCARFFICPGKSSSKTDVQTESKMNERTNEQMKKRKEKLLSICDPNEKQLKIIFRMIDKNNIIHI